MDKQIDLSKLGFAAGEKVRLEHDDWSHLGSDIIIVDMEPVPGSTQCLIREGSDFRTVSRGSLRHV
jgi:hypothetical protein